MREHHRETIEKLVKNFSENGKEDYLAVIIGGSVAKEVAKEQSDIDIMIVVSDALYKKKSETNDLIYFSTEFTDYPGGYVDGKIVNLEYIKQTADRGNEPTRAAFKGAIVAYSNIKDLDLKELIKRIPVYQKNEKEEKIQSFYAQFECAYWYIGEALKRNDRYLTYHAVSRFILYGGRLILAHNEILYPYHKLFMGELKKAEKKPKKLIEKIENLLDNPNNENAKILYHTVKDFKKWNKTSEIWPVRFLKDTELAWMEGKAFIGDL
ncbi:MAG: nucleotidyltransferase domain-containing protein [Promethearchaeota archaeon]